ncbi:MAG: PilZ domain-containing protein [Candidatus Xenobia bacterium]
MKWAEAIKKSLGIGNRRLELFEERTAARVPCHLDALVVLPNHTDLSGHVFDVSTRGFRLDLPQPVPLRQRMGIVLKGGSKDKRIRPELHLQATALWCHRSKDRHWEAGFESVLVGHEDTSAILQFLRRELALPMLDDRQRRRARRIAVPWLADYTVQGQKKRGLVKDVGLFGVQLVTPQPLLLNHEFDVEMIPEHGLTPVKARVVVRRCSPDDQHEGWSVACAFAEISARDQTALTDALKRHLQHHHV